MAKAELLELRGQFLAYLGKTFGDELLSSIREPPGVRIGERVLYRLRDHGEALRREPSARELEATRQDILRLAAGSGVPASRVTFEPPVSSGLAQPRLIDLPGSGIVWDRDLARYLESDGDLPAADFPLEWTLGVLLAPSENLLFHLDFTHPRVRAIFRVFYASESDAAPGERRAILDGFTAFRARVEQLRAETGGGAPWVKVVQMDPESLHVRIGGRTIGGTA